MKKKFRISGHGIGPSKAVALSWRLHDGTGDIKMARKSPA